MNNSRDGPETHVELNVVILLLINLFLRWQFKGTPLATFAQHASILFLGKHLACLSAKMWLLKISLSVIYRETEGSKHRWVITVLML